MRQRIIFMLAIAMLAFAVSACGGSANTTTQPAAPSGDAVKGQEVFNRGCNTCHHITTEHLVGPGLAGLFDPGGPTLPEGVDYGGKLSNGQPITDANVAAWIRSGGQGKIGVMLPNGGIADLTNTDITNIIAYLHTLKK